ncbi:MAG: hypothetical protein C5B50_21605 [Verrucomicrobia bacterium]|nr:MAG: hypothetical protein C5B50_21605 [Verrucomicrobiota bacterium]
MRPLNVQKLKEKIVALSFDLSQLELKRDQVVARWPGLVASDKPRFFRDFNEVLDGIKQTQRRLHIAKRLLARAQGDEYELQLP